MFPVGGSSSQQAASRCMRLHCHMARDSFPPFTPSNSVKVQTSLPLWKKQSLMQEMSNALRSVSSHLLQRFINSTYRFSELSVLNQGNFQPVDEIGETALLNEIEGEVPEDFPEGIYIRNGPNHLNPTQTIAYSIFGSTWYTHFEGQGMLHAMYFDKTTMGEWMISYLNKYVNSDTIELERQKSEVGFIPAGQPYAILAAFLRFGKPVKDSANTSIFKLSGRAFAISENHQPYEINISNLDTIGPYDIDGSWGRPFTSHPKMVQGSGELVIMGIDGQKPHYVLGIISPDGERLLHKVDLKFEEAKFIHELGVTTKYNIIMDYPLRFGISRTLLRNPLFDNDMNGKSRIGVMPRFGSAKSIIWFDVENHCSFHLFNCFEDGNEVVVRGCRTLASVIPGDKVAMDFPVINENFVGIRNKYGYAQVVDSVATSEIGLFKYNMIAKLHFDKQDQDNNQLISVEYHALQEKHYCSGVQFVAKKNAVDEDDGWVIAYVHDEGTNISQAYIIDAKRFGEKAIAKITLPQRVPYGFHCNFFYK